MLPRSSASFTAGIDPSGGSFTIGGGGGDCSRRTATPVSTSRGSALAGLRGLFRSQTFDAHQAAAVAAAALPGGRAPVKVGGQGLHQVALLPAPATPALPQPAVGRLPARPPCAPRLLRRQLSSAPLALGGGVPAFLDILPRINVNSYRLTVTVADSTVAWGVCSQRAFSV